MGRKLISLLLFGLLLSSCGQKVELEKELTGKIITKSGDEYILDTGEKTVNVASRKTNLDNYLKKTIKIEGAYSGSTFYIDTIKEN